MKIPRYKYIRVEALLFLLCLMLTIYDNKPVVSSSFPYITTNINETNILMPDWNNISFKDFPAINSSGELEVNGEVRIWKEGQTPDQYLKLQDISVLFPNLLNLANIMEKTKDLTLLNTSLDQFPLVNSQTVEHLLAIVPSLGKTKIKNIPLIRELFYSVLSYKVIQIEELPVASAVENTASLGGLTLNAIDLSKYPLSALKNIETVEIGQFKNWEKAYISQIPNLNKVPLAKYPVPIAPIGNAIGTIKFIWGKQDKVVKKTISGSYKVGFKYDCFNQQCNNINFDEDNNQKSAEKNVSWVWGKQLVAGGNGCLSSVNQGKEPTGRNPYGSLFKVVVEQIDDDKNKANSALYFRFSNWCGATPYVIGPIPFQNYEINSKVFLGSDSDENFIGNNPTKLSSFTTTEMGSENVVKFKVLAQVIADFHNSNYEYISDYLVNGDKVGRILGLYFFRSYDLMAVEAIESQPGGDDWLKTISTEKENPEGMSKYFSPAVQDSLFIDYLIALVQQTQKEIDPNTGQSFRETNLITRVLEKVYFGKASLVNSYTTNEDATALIKSLLDNYHNKAH